MKNAIEFLRKSADDLPPELMSALDRLESILDNDNRIAMLIEKLDKRLSAIETVSSVQKSIEGQDDPDEYVPKWPSLNYLRNQS